VVEAGFRTNTVGLEHYDVPPPGGESRKMTSERTLAFMNFKTLF
jgi:hypothetical protein